MTKQDTGEIIKLGCQPKKIDLVPNGVDVRKFHPSETVIPYSLLWCGRFVQQKGLSFLIKAIRILVKYKGQDQLRLFLTGNGPLLPLIHDMVKQYDLTNHVVFMGLIPREDLPKLIS